MGTDSRIGPSANQRTLKFDNTLGNSFDDLLLVLHVVLRLMRGSRPGPGPLPEVRLGFLARFELRQGKEHVRNDRSV